VKKVKKISVNCILITIFLSIFAASLLADKVTLVGEVNDNQEIVADGQIYTVGDSATGDDLVLNYISQRVKVVGRVVEKEEGKEIIVEFFEVVEE
jgi:hypothetical protein